MILTHLSPTTAHIIIINLDYNTSPQNMKNMFAIILTRKWDAKKLLCGSSWIGMVMGWKRKETCIIFHGQILTSYVHSFQFRFYFTLLFLNCIFVVMRYEICMKMHFHYLIYSRIKTFHDTTTLWKYMYLNLSL